jgi:DNA-binding protein YbaB
MKFNIGDICYFIGCRYQVIGFNIENSQISYKIIRFDYNNPSTEPEIVLEANPNLLTPSEWKEQQKFVDLQRIRSQYANMLERHGEDFANKQLKFLLAEFRMQYGEDLTDILLQKKEELGNAKIPDSILKKYQNKNCFGFCSNSDSIFDDVLRRSLKMDLNRVYGTRPKARIDVDIGWPTLQYLQGDMSLVECVKRMIEGEKSMDKEKKTSKKMSITINEAERVVTVVFPNGKKAMSRCSKDDKFDPYVGVALCIAAEQFGSKTKFKKYVDEHGKNVKAKKEK